MRSLLRFFRVVDEFLQEAPEECFGGNIQNYYPLPKYLIVIVLWTLLPFLAGRLAYRPA